MNLLVENNYISEINCGRNFSYVLNDNSMFLSTEYKVLQSQVNSCIVKCMKMLYNGKIQLFYNTNNMKSFESIIHNIDADGFMTIVANLLSDIIDVKHNGFLSCQNIDISFDRIFVDPTTYKVSLVYLPLRVRIYDDISTFENDLRTSLVKVINGVDSISSSKTVQFSDDLSNGKLSLEDLYSRIKGSKRDIKVAADREEPKNDISKTMYITAINAPKKVEFAVTKDNFVIGKRQDICDGVVDFSNTVSRSHCRINIKDGQYTITDLYSVNGTYVNRMKLQPNVSQVINNGDVIRLSNIDFQVSIR